MQLVKLQCQEISYVLMNSEGEYSACLSPEDVSLFSSGSCVLEVIQKHSFSDVRPSCPIMDISTVIVEQSDETNVQTKNNPNADDTALVKKVEEAKPNLQRNSFRSRKAV
jgi:hypothetical protein